MVVPEPIWFNVPKPVMALPTVMELLRLNAKLAPSAMETAPVPSVPVVPPLPICKVPVLMVVVPV